MKKVMFAAAVAASMVAFGAGEITSNNVVGYQTRNTAAGFSLTTPTFIPVGGGDYDIQDFKLGPDAAGDGTESIQVLDTEGQNNVTYVWLNQTGAQMDPGWYDINTWELITAKIPAGTGFLMSTTVTALDITTSGEVASKDTVVTVPAGFSVLGNCSPVDLDLQKMTLAATAKGDGTESIQVLDNEGQNNVTYVWLNQTGAQMDPGWYDINTWELITATVKAGEAFLFSTQGETTLTIPAAL